MFQQDIARGAQEPPAAAHAARPASSERRVLVVKGAHAGDNGQLMALARALAWPYETVYFRPSTPRVLTGRIADALGLDLGPSDRVASGPPWPDVILASGSRAVSAARRVKRLSGGRTRIVFVGRPRARLDTIDLVVTSPQYRLPERPNVLRNCLPLNGLDQQVLRQAAARWAGRLAHLQAPYISVLIGGDSGSYRLDRRTAVRMARRASELAHRCSGSVLASSSPRTPPSAWAAFVEALDAPAKCYQWRPDATENPYAAFLGLADRVLVTGESASMIAEAARTAKPFEVMGLPRRWRTRLLHMPVQRAMTRIGLGRVMAQMESTLTASGCWVPARDLSRLHAVLRDVADETSDGALRLRPEEDRDLAAAVRRIRRLLDQEGREPQASPPGEPQASPGGEGYAAAHIPSAGS